jgi:3D (Asp-Asp-Asp) domain-containing protein
MRYSLFIALGMSLVLGVPAQAKHLKHTKLASTQLAHSKKIAAVTPPEPLLRNGSSTKVTRAFLPPIPKVVAKARPATKSAVVAQAKVAAPVANTTLVARDGSTPTITQPLPKGALARLTAYWTGEDAYTSQHMSSTGVRLQEGNCAVDPSLIPYGSVVQIPGMGSYTAVDTGSAVVSRKAALGAAHNPDERNALVVDLFFENRREAEEFAAHGPSFVSVSWKKPVTAADAPLNPRALPASDSLLAQTARVQIYVLASAPSLADSRLPLNFRSPVIFQ